MSNIGKQKIEIPEGVNINIDNSLHEINIEGKLGSIKLKLSENINLEQDKDKVRVKSNNKKLWGTERTRIHNAIIGVSQGFQKTLKLVGIGYRAQIKDNSLLLKLGFSHDVIYDLPEGINAICPKVDQIVLIGIEKDFVCKIASNIRSLKKPDSYKGKGIRFEDEKLILKEGKKK